MLDVELYISPPNQHKLLGEMMGKLSHVLVLSMDCLEIEIYGRALKPMQEIKWHLSKASFTVKR